MNRSTPDTARFLPFDAFTDTAQVILHELHRRYAFDLWLLTENRGDDWVLLVVADRGYGVKPGDAFKWADTVCARMVEGLGPHVAPAVTAVPQYADSAICRRLRIGAYIGFPLLSQDGTLFGTLCAIHPEPVQPLESQQENEIALQARLLSTLLAEEHRFRAATSQLSKEKQRAYIDELTGVYNRRGWDHFLNIEEQRCRRYGTSVSIIVLDLDDLKPVNDTYGHARGDKLLGRVANLLRRVTRPFDTVARTGGDEFAILVTETNADAVNELADRIRSALAGEQIAASIGWATGHAGVSLNAVMQLSDRRMYDDKRRRKEFRRAH